MGGSKASWLHRAILHKMPFYRKEACGNFHPIWDRLCFCNVGEHWPSKETPWHGGVRDIKTGSEYIPVEQFLSVIGESVVSRQTIRDVQAVFGHENSTSMTPGQVEAANIAKVIDSAVCWGEDDVGKLGGPSPKLSELSDPTNNAMLELKQVIEEKYNKDRIVIPSEKPDAAYRPRWADCECSYGNDD